MTELPHLQNSGMTIISSYNINSNLNGTNNHMIQWETKIRKISEDINAVIENVNCLWNDMKVTNVFINLTL